MLVATLLLVVGSLANVVGTQLGSLRMGGVIVVPLFVVYGLFDFLAFPAFLASVVIAYGVIGLLRRRTLLYGRQLFLAAILAGAVLPLVVLFGVELLVERRVRVFEIQFVGSVLPGIAAYNFQRIDAERRLEDVAASVAVSLVLCVVGVVGLLAVERTGVGAAVPAVLSASTSDIAVALGIATDGQRLLPPLGRTLTTLVAALGLIASEGARRRWGVRIGGIVTIPLVAVFTLRNGWLLPTYLAVALTVFVALRLLNWLTLLYGRVLLAMGVIVGLFTVLPLATVAPITHGLFALFVGLFGSITAYNFEVTSPSERPC